MRAEPGPGRVVRPGPGSAAEVLGQLAAALGAEATKVGRSRVPALSAAVIAAVGLLVAFFTFVLQDPERARGLGLLGTKAQIFGGVTGWEGHLSLTAQAAAVGGTLVFGVVVVWLFGREAADGTAKDLLALPTSRSAVVTAKCLLALLWCLLLAGGLVALCLVGGLALGLPQAVPGVVAAGLGRVLAVAALTAALALVHALAASVGRGYLPGVVGLLAVLAASQVVAALGFGSWFPWSVPALLSGAAGADQVGVPALAIVLSACAGPLAGVVTAVWWERADHSR